MAQLGLVDSSAHMPMVMHVQRCFAAAVLRRLGAGWCVIVSPIWVFHHNDAFTEQGMRLRCKYSNMEPDLLQPLWGDEGVRAFCGLVRTLRALSAPVKLRV